MARVAIVGAGPAGCLAARRLVDAGHDVTLCEAGERLVPTLDFASLLDRTDLRWSTESPNGAVASGVIRARVVGGASAINGMLLSAPDSTDLASWDAALGQTDGSARSSLERVIAEVAPQIATPGPLARGLSDAALTAGDQIGGSTLDVDARGVLAAALAARSGERRDAPAVYLADAPDTLRVQTGTTITSLDDLLLHDAEHARFDHVVVSAGALASPGLVAGVVPEVVVAPAQQHLAVALPVPLAGDQRVGPDQPAVARVVRWCSELEPDDARADVQLVVLDHMGWHPAGRSQGLVIVSLLAGSTLGVETTATDRARLRSGVRRAQMLLAAAGFEVPGPDAADFEAVDASHVADAGDADALLSDAELDSWISRQPNPVHHVTSTMPLGSAVGRAGLVAGRTDLSVIDASVLPSSPRADTNMAVLVMADLLATQLVDHLASQPA